MRRQQLGILRAIGFSRRMVQGLFVLESLFVTLTSIVLGAGFGLVISYNVVSDAAEQPSWSGLGLEVPWLNLLVVFALVLGAGLLATLASARRGARVAPAEALRYQ